MKALTCFLISPIGGKDSEIRKNANDLLDLIIEPALEKYDFVISRADKLTTVSSITNDVINYVQNSDLCIIDLTGQNSNVMYELGRRHESGKPFILLAKDGEKLPFDINTIRTVFYNMTNPKDIRDTVKVIQSFIEKQIENGFAPSSSGESLTSISESLKRIENGINSLKHIRTDMSVSGIEINSDILEKLSPKDAFRFSLKENNLGLAESLLPQIKQITSVDNYFETYIQQLALEGSNIAAKTIEENFNYICSLNIDSQASIIGSLVNYYSIHDLEKNGIDFLQEYFSKIDEENIDAKTLAKILNYKQKLLIGIQDLENAIEIGKKVIELDPTDIHYYYNLALSYYSIDNIENAIKTINQCLNLSNNNFDGDHLSLAINIYREKGDKKKEMELLELLKQVNPYKYKLEK
jgi:hypothetical protein